MEKAEVSCGAGRIVAFGCGASRIVATSVQHILVFQNKKAEIKVLQSWISSNAINNEALTWKHVFTR